MGDGDSRGGEGVGGRGWGMRDGGGLGFMFLLNWWKHPTEVAGATKHFTPKVRNLAIRHHLWNRKPRTCASPKLGKILSFVPRLAHLCQSLGKTKRFLHFVPLLWCKGWGRKNAFCHNNLFSFFLQWTPPPLGKYKKRNRIMHVFLKFAFMITLNFVYYYLCIIEIECYFILYESTSFHSDIYFMSCKIVPSALPHFENKSLEMIFFLKNNDKGKKQTKKN